MPFAEDGRLGAQGLAGLKGPPPSPEAVAVDINQVFVLELLVERDGVFDGHIAILESESRIQAHATESNIKGLLRRAGCVEVRSFVVLLIGCLGEDRNIVSSQHFRSVG